MIRWLLFLFLGLFVSVAGIYGAGSALPETLVSVRMAEFNTPLPTVWEAVTDYEKLPDWNPYVRAARQIPNPESDAPLWHIEDSNGNNMVVEVVTSISHVSYHVQLVENTLPFSGSWEFEFAPKDAPDTASETKQDAPSASEAEGTEETEALAPQGQNGALIKMREMSVIPNPFVRFFRYYVIGIDKGMHIYLQSLGKHFGENIEVKEVAL